MTKGTALIVILFDIILISSFTSGKPHLLFTMIINIFMSIDVSEEEAGPEECGQMILKNGQNRIIISV